MEITINWTDEKKQAVIEKIDAWIRKHDATAGEVIMQSDECIISAPEILSELVDDIIQPEVSYGDED